jgi:hypothetical protein
MDIVGDVGGGKMGVLSIEQAASWIQEKDTRATTKVLEGKFKSVVGTIVGTKGGNDQGGGNTRYTFHGLPLHHESAGAGYNEGVSLFYVKQPGNLAKIVGVGYHTGAQTYSLTWVHHDWTRMRNVHTISLDKKAK